MRLAIFASGGGSNAEALMAMAITRGTPYAVVVCATNRSDAGVIDRAGRYDIPVEVLSADQVASGPKILDALERHHVEAIALAGYLRMIPVEVVQAFRHRILNIHPALLPSFGGHGMYGMNVHRAVIDSGVRWSGATVHMVDEAYDTGPIVLQEVVPVEPGDSPEVLAARVLRTEHMIYPTAVRLLAEGRLKVEGRKVLLLEHDDPDSKDDSPVSTF
jgi:phosphoribosylglycinamide formyltransferase 1